VDDAGGLVGPILRRVDAKEMQGITVDSGGIRSFMFLPDGTAQPNGSAQEANWALKICDPGDSSRIRQVSVNLMGRTYVQCTDPSPYTCPATCP
jgi:hypothetical protein